MRPEDILELLRKHPFEPFRIHLSDGVAYDVRHPDMAIVQRSKVIVAVPGPEGPDGPAQYRDSHGAGSSPATVHCALIPILSPFCKGGQRGVRARTEAVNGSTTRR